MKKKGGNKSEDKTCCKCNEKEHIAKDCPKKGKDDMKKDRASNYGNDDSH